MTTFHENWQFRYLGTLWMISCLLEHLTRNIKSNVNQCFDVSNVIIKIDSSLIESFDYHYMAFLCTNKMGYRNQPSQSNFPFSRSAEKTWLSCLCIPEVMTYLLLSVWFALSCQDLFGIVPLWYSWNLQLGYIRPTGAGDLGGAM